MLDGQSINIPCKNCGENTPQTVGWLKSNGKFTCACGTVINVDSSDFLREIKKVEDSLDDFKAKVGNIKINL